MKKFIIFYILFFISNLIYSEKFIFKYIPGSKQKIEATINGKQYQNKQFLLDYIQTYKTIRTIKEVKDNIGYIEDLNYFYNQNKYINKEILEVKDTTTANYSKNFLGTMKVLDNAFFPTFRNVPVFPDANLQQGQSWIKEGMEVQDLFGDKTQSIFPLTVRYNFIGYETINGKKVAKIKYSHSIDIVNNGRNNIDPRIKRVVGLSDTILYFDNELGMQVREEYTRDYSFLISGVGGDFIATFVDNGVRIWSNIELMDKDKIVDDINKKLKEENVEDATVTKDDKGVKLQLENLHFYPDSSELLPEEKERLNKVAKILKNYKEKGIMIIGHTAFAGTKKARDQLSVDRAKVIVDYLIDQEAINVSKSSFGGKGAEEPIADNATEEGMKRNRRAEIYILEE
ncbi:MAG: OmpA family protein [Spirochaetes bacterium]|nr:OmpA family protein [Spirochaetota bacterium]